MPHGPLSLADPTPLARFRCHLWVADALARLASTASPPAVRKWVEMQGTSPVPWDSPGRLRRAIDGSRRNGGWAAEHHQTAAHGGAFIFARGPLQAAQGMTDAASTPTYPRC